MALAIPGATTRAAASALGAGRVDMTAVGDTLALGTVMPDIVVLVVSMTTVPVTSCDEASAS